MKTAEFVRGKEWDILADYGFHRTDNRHIDCPICEGKKKFRISEFNGEPSYICVCGSGNMFKLLCEVTAKSFADIASDIDTKYGNDSRDGFNPEPKKKIDYHSLPEIDGTNAQIYLKSRGINILPKHCVRFEPSSNSMHAIAIDPNMRPAYIHRTYLDGAVKRERKMETVSKCQNFSVRMFPIDSCIGIAEGIESGLSAAQIYKMPVWAVLNTSGMKNFRAPLGVRTLIIYADNDRHAAGLAAAFHCAHHNVLCKNDVTRVVVKWPNSGDFNDHLLEPAKVFEWEVSKEVE